MLRTATRRRPTRTLQAILRSKAMPAPVEGWDASSALANMKETRAVQLKNWFPQPGYVEVRKGYEWHSWDLGSSPKTVSAIEVSTTSSLLANETEGFVLDFTTAYAGIKYESANTLTSNAHGYTNGTPVKIHAATTMPAGLSTTRVYYVIEATTNTFKLSKSVGGNPVEITSTGSGTITVYEVDEPEVETLAIWQGPTNSKMIAAAGGVLWDVTSNEAAMLSKTSGTINRWQWCNHTTSAGAFLFMVNGTDAPLHYNGTTWTAPTITGITVADAVNVISHKKRLWFVLKDTTKGAYLGTEAVAGAASTFEFGSLFTRGGYLLALATWTRDGGSGSDDYFVAISSRGQVAVYQGTDPASANTWALVGVFDVPTPIGRRCFTRFGGDVLLTTVEGVFPLSQLLSVDQSQSDRVAISARISSAFNEAALSYQTLFGWEACVYSKGTRLIVNIPTAENSTAKQYVMNTLTGAWCEFDNHNANTWVVFNDNLYFAGNAGDVYKADTGRADIDTPIVAVGQTAYSAFGAANVKRFSMVKPLVTATGTNRPALGLSSDFVETSTLSTPIAVAETGRSVWDGGALWDGGAVWGGSDVVQSSEWTSIPAIGTFGSIKFQAQTGTAVGGDVWSLAVWGTSFWGSDAATTEEMKIQGFVLLHEVGEYI